MDQGLIGNDKLLLQELTKGLQIKLLTIIATKIAGLEHNTKDKFHNSNRDRDA